MPQLAHVQLDISDPETSLDFYTRCLGMRLNATDSDSKSEATVYSLAFATGASLELRRRQSERFVVARYQPSAADVYWKIGVTVPDVDIARERLISNGVEVTEPMQFHDIGYLCHLDDPDGYCIELLQHTFEWNHSPQPVVESEALGSRPNLGQVSLNVTNINDSLAFYRDRMGLKVLSRQSVPDRGFTLWFLGDPELTPPSESIDAIENREWLWSLSETTLELRAYNHTVESRQAHPPTDELGFRGIGFSGGVESQLSLEDPDDVRVLLCDR